MNKKYHKKALKHNIFKMISQVSIDTGIRSYVVGGFVRDYFLGISNCDIDIVVEGSGIEFATCFSKKVNGKLSYFENYGTANVRIDDIEVEFVGARKEMYERGSRKPIVEEGTLYDDISRRDFTINAMALSLNSDNYGELIDYYGGYNDLSLKIIKTPLNPDVTFSDDPLRMFRAIRFASKLHDFKIDDNAKDSIKRNCKRCEILSRERITSEIEKMFSYEDPKCGLLLLNELCLWDYAFPNNEFNEIYVNCISKSENILLRWFFASMNYKGDFISFIHDMKLSNELAKSLNAIKYTFDNFKDTSFPSLYKVRTSLYKSGKLAFNALKAVFTYIKETTCIPDDIIIEWYEFTVSGFYENLEFIDYHLPCNGKEISEYSSIPEGKELGEFINTIKEEIFHGHIKNTRLSVLEMSKHAKMLKIIGK